MEYPKNITVLNGHNGFENALVVKNYPYGFRLKTDIKYWIESNKNKGDRLITQTLNPKTSLWNKPKKGTYTAVEVLYKENDSGHVHSIAITESWTNEKELNEFLQLAKNYNFNALQLEKIKRIKAYIETRKHITVTCVNATAWSEAEKQAHEAKQAEIKKDIGKLFQHNLSKL